MKTAALTPWERTPEADDKDPRHVLRQRAFTARQESVWDTRDTSKATATATAGCEKHRVDIEASRVKIPTCKPACGAPKPYEQCKRGAPKTTRSTRRKALGVFELGGKFGIKDDGVR
jgi:hypothetical protein